jgi:hypothetical protein
VRATVAATDGSVSEMRSGIASGPQKPSVVIASTSKRKTPHAGLA